MGQDRPEQTGTDGCLYDMAGILCGKPIRARGYCMAHYKVLNRRGAFKTPKALTPGNTAAGVDRNIGHIERAKLALDKHAETFVEHLVVASAAAAAKGNSAPAQYGLEMTRTVVQPAAVKDSSQVGGIRVMIGVQLGGTQASQPTATATIDQPQNAGSLDHPSQSLPTLEAQLIPT